MQSVKIAERFRRSMSAHGKILMQLLLSEITQRSMEVVGRPGVTKRDYYGVQKACIWEIVWKYK